MAQLAELLELRRKYLGHEDDLLGDIHRWLRTDEAQAIGRWDNLPPNNTLLSHRDYRRVWDAWRWLQVLDDNLARDASVLDVRAATVEKWVGFGTSYAEGATLFGDMPVLFDYDNFAIETWREPVLRAAESTTRPDRDRPAVDGPACVDLTYLRPRFATIGSKAPSTLPETYLWQRWRSGSDSVDLELFNADIALLHPDATSISITDLFFSQDADQSSRTGRARVHPTAQQDLLPIRRCSGWSRTSSTTSNSKSHGGTSTQGFRKPNHCQDQSRRSSSRLPTRRSRATGSRWLSWTKREGQPTRRS